VSSASERRNRHNVFTLTGALLASFAIVFVVILLTVRPDPSIRPAIDWHSVAASASSPVALADPTFDSSDGDWWANRAEYIDGANPEWYIGFVSPTNGFVAIHQFTNDVSAELADVLGSVPGAPVSLGGAQWVAYDRSQLDNPGNYRTVYEIDLPDGGILMVSGTAEDAEIERVASLALESVTSTQTGKG
jgi:hypothetical protein